MDSILLIRVSTVAQDYTAQAKELKEYANNKGYHEHYIIQDKESGYKDEHDRNGLNELKQLILNDKNIKAVFVWEISRLARSQKVLFSIRDFLIKSKVNLYIKDKDYRLLDDNYELDSNTDLLFNLYGYFAESEMKIKKERFKRGKTESKLLGKFAGGKRLFGYNIGSDNQYTINESEANEIRAIFDMYINENFSLREIAINCIANNFSRYTHSKRNINKLIKEQGYTGEKISHYNHTSKDKDINTGHRIVLYQTSYKMIYPAIISNETFDNAQIKLAKNKSSKDKSRIHITLLAKIIKCSNCGCFYSGNYRYDGKYDKSTYACVRRKHPLIKCKSATLSMIAIDSIVWELTKRHLNTQSILKQTSNEAEIENMKSKIAKLNEKLKSLDSLIEAESTIFRTNIRLEIKSKDILQKEYIKNINKINSDKKVIEKTIFQIQDDINNLLSIDSKRNLEIEFEQNIEEIEKSKREMKKYINAFIKEIIIMYSDKLYTVLSIIFKNANRFSKIYLAIDKKDTNRKKVCYTYDMYYVFDTNSKAFVANINEYSTLRYLQKIELENIFSLDNLSTAKQYVNIITYKKLKLYSILPIE